MEKVFLRVELDIQRKSWVITFIGKPRLFSDLSVSLPFPLTKQR